MPEINYRITTPSLQESRPTRYSPISGILNSAIIHFPAGLNSYVEVIIYKGTNQLLPTPVKGGAGSTGIALDDTTQSFDINEPVEQGEPLEVHILNHDGANPHTITVVLLIAKQQSYTGP